MTGSFTKVFVAMKTVKLLIAVLTLTPGASARNLWNPHDASPVTSTRATGDRRHALPAHPSGKDGSWTGKDGSEAVQIRGGADGEGGKATILSSVFNLGMFVLEARPILQPVAPMYLTYHFPFQSVNNVAGAGILTLPSGMSGTGWVPAMIICAVLGALSGHCFSIIGEACELTGEADFKGLWKRTIGQDSAYLVDVMIAVMCLACSVIYSGILGDVFTQLIGQFGLLPASWNRRASNIVGITVALLLPLSSIKDLSALAFTSVLGFSAIMYTVLFVIVRSLDGTYKLHTGKFLQDSLIAATPSFGQTSLWNFNFISLVLASNLGLAYIAHYNGPNFYRSLKKTNSKRFRVMVNISFTILVVLYVATMTAGYSTFGDACQGNILLNYHPDDILSTLGRLATGFSILFGFPLVACGAREAIVGVASSLGNDSLGTDKNHLKLVAGILGVVTLVSCTVNDVSLVVGLTGAALGSFIVYICPSLIFTKAVALVKGPESNESKRARINLVLVPFGLCIAFLGCFMTIKEAISK
jgi:amino acid permease